MLRDSIIFIVAVVLVFALIIGVAVVVTYVTGKAACDDFAARNPEYEFQYSFWNGCMVKLPNGMWLSAKNINWINGKIQIGQ